MSLIDRLSTQDTMQLLTTGAGLALVTAGSQTGFAYNFPLMLFGILALELQSSTAPFRQFLILILFTGLIDIYTLLFHKLSTLVLLISILLTLLKPPIFYSGLVQLRERGGELRWGEGGWGIGGMQGQGGNWSIPTTMPGGFSNFGSGPNAGSAPGGATPSGRGPSPQPTASFPSSGGFRLGGDDDEGQGHTAPGPAPGRGGYSTIA
ncbi:hypothetical protein IAT38_005196 [Cryptococcus sp. DSM 104549]